MAVGDTKTAFGAKTALTISLASVTSTSSRESTVVDNATNKFIDAMLRIVTKGAAGSTSVLNLYLYAALGDTTYTDGASGSDAAFTTANIKNAILLDTILMNGTTSVTWGPKSIVRLANLLVLPDKWGIIVHNASGGTLSATGGDHVVEFEGVYYNTAAT